MTRQAALFHARQRRRSESRGLRFRGLVSAPFDLGTHGSSLPNPFVMPAGANTGISMDSAVTAGELRVLVGSRTLATPALSANQIWRIGFFERDFSLTVEGEAVGAVTLHYFDEWFRPSAVATGSLT